MEKSTNRIAHKRKIAAGVKAAWTAVFACLVWHASGCNSSESTKRASPEEETETEAPRPQTSEHPAVATITPSPAELLAQANAKAQARIDEVMKLPPMPGAPGFEKHRAAMVARAKSEPVVFVRTPQYEETSPGIASLRAAFERTDFPWKELRQLRRRFWTRPHVLRELLLREGYLYSEEPNHAFTLVSQLKPRHLFEEKQIWVHRGRWLMHAERREKGDYFFLDGPEEGRKVRLLHLDRVGTGEVPAPLHRDFRGLRYRLFFERARILHITEEYIVAELRYGKHWVKTLLQSEREKLSRVAEIIDPPIADELRETRTVLERKARAVAVLRGAMRAQIDEGLPFDEPKTEVGQQDGTLRRLWRLAYYSGQTSFRFNDDRYQVFNSDGQPWVPQVCIDFMVDTFERASGSWWKAESVGAREKTAGKLDLAEFDREELRRTKGFLQFAREHSEWFDVLTFPKYMRVELGYKPRFFRWLEKKTDHFEPGDIVFIRGVTPWDLEDEHSHSFFIFESDPVSGIPIAIAGNAGPANLWSWETEARRTPNRTVRDRIRPKLEWLESFLEIDRDQVLEPPALVSGRK